MAPPWLPDWRDAKSYATITSRLDWAWQFLRRNPEYQRLWAQLIQPHYDPADVQDSLRVGFQVVSDRVRIPVDGPKYDLLPFVERFGIRTVPPDPSESNPKLMFSAQFIRYASKPLRRGVKPGWMYKIPAVVEDDEVLVWFDLRWSTDQQLSKAKKLLKEIGAKKGRNKFRARPDQYLDYIRLLDAQESQASTTKMAQFIYPGIGNVYPDYAGNKQVRKDLKIAQRLRDRDFWRIAAGEK